MVDFCIRFYNQTDAKVEECLAALKAINPKITGHKNSDQVLGMNPTIKPSHVIDLIVPTTEDAVAMRDDPAFREIYMKYAAGGGTTGEFQPRSPGQNTYRF